MRAAVIGVAIFVGAILLSILVWYLQDDEIADYGINVLSKSQIEGLGAEMKARGLLTPVPMVKLSELLSEDRVPPTSNAMLLAWDRSGYNRGSIELLRLENFKGCKFQIGDYGFPMVRVSDWGIYNKDDLGKFNRGDYADLIERVVIYHRSGENLGQYIRYGY